MFVFFILRSNSQIYILILELRFEFSVDLLPKDMLINQKRQSAIVDSLRKDCYYYQLMRPKQLRKFQHFVQSIVRKLRWLIPGIGIKRWILLILVGTTMLGVGFAFLLLDIYRTAPDNWLLPIIKLVSLQFVTDRTLRALFFGITGITITILGVVGLNRADCRNRI